jgi:hypothetical protein
MASAVNATDRERFERARARGKARAAEPSAVVDASYETEGDAFNLTFRSGATMAIPRRMVAGLDRAPTSVLQGRGIPRKWGKGRASEKNRRLNNL